MNGYQMFAVTVTNTTRTVVPATSPEVERMVIQAALTGAPVDARVYVARVRYDHDTGEAEDVTE